MALLRLTNVVQRHTEQRSGRRFEALRVRELSVREGEVVSAVGPNGSGKTTLLETLALLRRPDEGRVLWKGLDAWAEGRTLPARRECPMLLQETVLFSMSVLDNVMYGLRLRHLTRAESLRRARQALRLVGMHDLSHRRHDELSGGEKRRVALARVLALQCKVIVLDEPTAGLDRENEELIEEVIRAINRRDGVTVIMASHNLRQAVALSTRILTLLDGKLIPENLENLFFGTMRRTETGFEFRGRRGWAHSFQPEEMTIDAWEGVGPAEGPVKLAIPSGEILVIPLPQQDDQPLWGVVDALGRNGDTCQISVKLSDGPSLNAAIPSKAFAELNLSLGDRVSVRLRPGAVRVLGASPSP
jgi:ABC-type multidrug transport system ATPase subunit